MILEIGLAVAVVAGAERAYKAYKNGTLVSDITTLASTLRNDVANVETKVKAAVPVAEADVAAVVASAKAVLAKVGL
jgi:hypothetical protein